MNKLALLAPMAALALGGCISLGAKPPKSLLTLTSATSVPVGQPQSSAKAETITIAVPWVPQELATGRIPVHSGTVAVAYVKDAQWVEQPSRLFARMLADTVTARTGRVVLSNRQSQIDPGAQLTGELRRFGVDAETNEAVVTFDAALMRGPEAVFEKQRFEARIKVARIDATSVGAALGTAANQVAVQIADWVGR